MTTSHDHFYGDEPECALCGHYGPDSDPKPCISRHEVGKVVHGLRRRLAVAYTKSKGEALVALTNAILADEAKLKARIDELLEANNRYLEEARIAKRMSAVTATALSAAQVKIQVLREALEFYADESLSNDARETDQGTTAEQALQDVFGDERPRLDGSAKAPPNLDELRDRFTEEELAVMDGVFGGGAKHDEIVLRMFHEAALSRSKERP